MHICVKSGHLLEGQGHFDSYVSKKEVPRGVRNSKVQKHNKFERDWSNRAKTFLLVQ